jgi:hypothetical protein
MTYILSANQKFNCFFTTLQQLTGLEPVYVDGGPEEKSSGTLSSSNNIHFNISFLCNEDDAMENSSINVRIHAQTKNEELALNDYSRWNFVVSDAIGTDELRMLRVSSRVKGMVKYAESQSAQC